MAIGETGTARPEGVSSGQETGSTTPSKKVVATTKKRRATDDLLANGLGWFSIALGAAEVLAPSILSRLIGVRPRPILLRAFGVREIVSGIGILSNPKPAGPLWSRVVGDAMDLTALGVALGSDETAMGRALFATTSVLGVTALDIATAMRHTRRTSRAVKTIAINKTPDECYTFWRQLENLPRFMDALESVTETDDRTSHWVAKGPGGKNVEWDAEIVRDDPGALIAWRSVEGSEVMTRGVVEFNPGPGGRGTMLHVALQYDPPAGSLGALVAKLSMTAPEVQLKDSLRHFKAILETGEVPTTEGQPSGPRAASHRALAKFFTGGVS